MGLGGDLLGKDGVDLRAGVLGVTEELLVPVLEERLLNERVDKGRAASAGRAWGQLPSMKVGRGLWDDAGQPSKARWNSPKDEGYDDIFCRSRPRSIGSLQML